MIFTKLRWKNTLSSGNQWTEIELNKHKTCLVVGENGAGKSTMLDALSFALFNKPFRPDFNKPQLVNSINKKGMVVEVEFYIGRREYKIIRGQKPNIFEVYENGKLLNQDANVRDYQDYLEKNIIKVNHRSFCQVVILGSANYTPFMKLPAQFRREVVEDILDLKIFGLMNSVLGTKKQQVERQLADNTTEKKLLTQKIDLIKHHNKEITATNNQLIEDKKERIAEATNNIRTAEIDIEHLLGYQAEEEHSIQDADKQQLLATELSHLKYKLETKITNLQKGIDFFEDNETCPTCSQNIDSDFKCDTIIKKKLSIDEASDALVKVNEKLIKVNERLSQISGVQKNINSIILSIHQHRNTIEQLKKYVKELESEVKLVESHNKRVDKQELIKLTVELSDVSIEYNKLVSRKNMLDMAGILLKDSGIKSKIIKQYIPIINKLLSKYLSMLDFFVQFTINERFEETVLSRYRDEFTYGSFSEGEKFRINIAFLFTWRSIAKMRNSVNTNILFLDEILDASLDPQGTDETLKLINQVEENVFIISPKGDQLFDKFDNTIRFVKHQNFSKMVQS
jgi:DNA repair exonuclease SbcCD ATPase subunit